MPLLLRHDDFRAAVMGDAEDVENPPVAGGKNPRVENIEAERAQHAGDRREKPGPVLGTNHYRSAIAFGKMRHRHFGILAAQFFHQFEMARNIAFRRRDKIAVRHVLDEALDLRFVIILAQLAAHPGLHPANHRAHVLALELALLRFLEQIESFDIEFAQQRRFPGIPNIRPHRFDVGKGEQKKHFEIVHATHRFRELENGFFILQVAPKRRVGHEQMMAHEKLDQGAVVGVETHALGDGPDHFRADLRMAAAETLADVVKHHAQIKQLDLLGFPGDLGE